MPYKYTPKLTLIKDAGKETSDYMNGNCKYDY